MRVLFVHPSSLMYSDIYLTLEPLGLERVAAAARSDGHDVRLIDLQLFSHEEYFACLRQFEPEAIGFSLNYLANVPEAVDLAKATKSILPHAFVFLGGHSVSFIAEHVLGHGDGAIDAVLRGEGEASIAQLLEAAPDGGVATVPGAVGTDGTGPPPQLLGDLADHLPARDIGGRRRKYFIGVLDPSASSEFSRGCPWDCSFCSAWTFYGRSYRQLSPEAAAEDVGRIKEPGVFLVDDVAFIKPDHGMAIAEEIERRGIKKQYYLETRCDLLVRHTEVFKAWKRLGLEYVFLGLEAIDDAGLKAYRKRSTVDVNMRALEVAREIGLQVAINVIADPDWDEDRFEIVRQWAMTVPEIVHLTVMTPYPGTEMWHTESRRLTSLDYRLFDVQHAVLPTRLPLHRFYEELVKTQSVLARKHLGAAALAKTSGIVLHHLLNGQTNFLKMLWKFKQVFNADLQYSDHLRPVRYELPPPPEPAPGDRGPDRKDLYVHVPVRLRD